MFSTLKENSDEYLQKCLHRKDKAKNTLDLIGAVSRWRASAHLKIKDSCLIPHLQLHSHKLITFFLACGEPWHRIRVFHSQSFYIHGDFYSQSSRHWELSTGISPVPGTMWSVRAVPHEPKSFLISKIIAHNLIIWYWLDFIFNTFSNGDFQKLSVS